MAAKYMDGSFTISLRLAPVSTFADNSVAKPVHLLNHTSAFLSSTNSLKILKEFCAPQG
jgi:hypothetical protein